MAEWPTALPAPQKQLSFSPGSNLVRRKLQSGRVEVRRMGSRAPGKIEAVFRLRADQLGAFEYFYERNLCLGVNWFTASWLNTGDKARFGGHPRTVGRLGEYFDVAATLLLVDELDWTPEDVLWPTGGTGGGETPSEGGSVKLWGDTSNSVYNTVIANTPTDLVAKKVVIGNGWAAALKSDGTLFCWGTAPALTQIPGWEALGGIRDIESGGHGLYYITTSGGLGYITSKTPASNNAYYYTPSGLTGLTGFAGRYFGREGFSHCVVNSSGAWRGWGGSASITTNINNAVSGFTGATAQFCSGEHGFVFFDSGSMVKVALGTTDSYHAGQSYAPATAQQIAAHCRYYGVAYNNGVWVYWGDFANSGGVQTARPAGLVPVALYLWQNGMAALNQDGTFLTWGGSPTPNPPASSFKFLSVSFYDYKLAAGILKSS